MKDSRGHRYTQQINTCSEVGEKATVEKRLVGGGGGGVRAYWQQFKRAIPLT